MPRERQTPEYGFRPLGRADLALLGRWLREPHVARWWDDAATALADIEDHIESISVEPLIVELDGRPIAYLQAYDPHLEDDHPYADQPFGTIGLDLTIGVPDLVGKGHGPSMLRQFVDTLFEEGTPRVVIDPDPANRPAVRAYEKAGFQPIEERDTPFGRVLLMARDSDEADEE